MKMSERIFEFKKEARDLLSPVSRMVSEKFCAAKNAICEAAREIRNDIINKIESANPAALIIPAAPLPAIGVFGIFASEICLAPQQPVLAVAGAVTSSVILGTGMAFLMMGLVKRHAPGPIF